MSVTIESDLKEVLAKLEQKLDSIDKKFEQKLDKLSEDVSRLNVGQARLEEKVDGLEKSLGAKIDGLSKRMENQEFLSRGVLAGLLVALLGGFAKLFGMLGQ